jgi:hypothetical protein
MAERRFDEVPGLAGLYGRAALESIPGIGRLPVPGLGGRSDRLPDTEMVVADATADPERVASYCRVCGFTLRDTLPPTYPHMLAFPLQMALIVSEPFPFAGMGLVHVGNRIVQHRPIGTGESLEIRVRADSLRPHPKGRQFDLLTEALSEGEVVWESTGTTLHRGSRGDEDPLDSGEDRFDRIDFGALPEGAEWRLDAGLGRRYAGVSGDRNPIHMSEWTAKPLGFPKAIAHGMWTKARSLAALERELPGWLDVEARFKKPVLLPSTVKFASAQRDGGAIAFAVRSADGSPHLDGLLAPLGED